MMNYLMKKSDLTFERDVIIQRRGLCEGKD